MKNLISTSDLSKAVGVKEHRLTYAMRAGHLPQPKVRLAGRKLFDPKEAKNVALYFGASLMNAEEGGANEQK